MSSSDSPDGSPGEAPLLEASPGSQTLLALDAAGAGLARLPDRAFENCLVVSPRPPAAVADALDDREIPLRGCGHLHLGTDPVEYDGTLWTTGPIHPGDATELSIHFADAVDQLEPGDEWLFLEGLHLVAGAADPSVAYRLVTRMARTARLDDVTGVYALDRTAIPGRAVASLRVQLDEIHR